MGIKNHYIAGIMYIFLDLEPHLGSEPYREDRDNSLVDIERLSSLNARLYYEDYHEKNFAHLRTFYG